MGFVELPPERSKYRVSSVNLNTQPGSVPAMNLSFSSLPGGDMSEMLEE